MDYDNVYKTVGFTIENNIIKGEPKPYCMKTCDLGKVILDIFDGNPEHVSQIEAETGQQTTYAEMKERSVRCAQWLKSQGIGSGDIVSVCVDNKLDAYVPEVAIFFVGAAYNPWHHDVALKPARHLIRLIRPKIMFACESAIDALIEASRLEAIDVKFVVFGQYGNIVSLDDVTKSETNGKKFIPVTIKRADEPALIIFTSGSSGLPKGVVHSYGNLSRNILRFARLPRKNEIMLWYVSPYWLTSVYFGLQLLLLGATRVLHATFEPKATLNVIEKYRVSWFFITTDMINVFNKSGVFSKQRPSPDSLRLVQTGGSKINREVFEEFQNSLPDTTVIQGYGMCELGGTATMQNEKCKRVDSAGFVVEHVHVKIVDLTTDRALGANQEGELCCKSPTMMLGYYDDPVATRETIDEDGWIHSGDKAYYDVDGEVFIVERLKQVMKFRAYHISPTEIEETLLSHPAVMEVAVVPLPHELDGERPIAFVAKVSGSEVTEKELVELSATLGEYKKLWGGVKFLEALPHTPSGKIARAELMEMARDLAKR